MNAESRPPAVNEAAAPARIEHVAEIAHATRGRVRLRLPAAKSEPLLLEQVRAALALQPGIDRVSVGASGSGSLVIHYDPDHHPDVASLFRSFSEAGGPDAVQIAQPQTQRHAASAMPAQPNGKTHTAARTKLDEEISQIEQEAEFLAEHSTLARSIVQSVKSFDQQIKRSTNNTVDLKILAPVGLAAFTFLEIGALAATPMWVTLVIFSLNHFVELRAHGAGDQPPPAKDD